METSPGVHLGKSVRGLLQAYELIETFRRVRPEMPIQMASVFLAVAMKPGIYQRELAPLLGMAQSSVSRNVTALGPRTRQGGLGLNLVVQRHEPTDGKSYELHLTKEGRELAEQLLALGGR